VCRCCRLPRVNDSKQSHDNPSHARLCVQLLRQCWASKFSNMGATGVPGSTFAVCYVMWLVHGCSPFLPLISDLGMHGMMRPMFCGGLVINAVFQAMANIESWYMRCFSIKGQVNSQLLHVINCASVMTWRRCGWWLPWDLLLGQRCEAQPAVCQNDILWRIR